MKRRDFLKTTGMAAGAAALPHWVSGQAEQTNKPNVVLIITDDQGWGDIHSHGNDALDTPVLDHLAADGVPLKTKGYITDVLTDAAMEFVETNKDRPFFCYIPYNAPHSPWQVPDKYFDKYKTRGLDDTTACAYGMVENIDDNLGRLFAQLDALNLANNTIVLFTADNGPNSDRYNGRMKGRKGSVHEGGVRAPLFMRWPGHIKPGSEIKQIAAHIDLLPTLADLCGVPRRETLPLDGVSLVPLLEGKTTNWPDRMIFSHWGNRGSVRSQDWRAVKEGGKNAAWQLYDMTRDPDQKVNIAKQHPDVLGRLRRAYDEWYTEVTQLGFDPIPTEIGHPEAPDVTLPGHEAFLVPDSREGISYVGPSGWANDWITNWTDANAYPYWEVEIVRPGRYEISLMYICPKKDVGAKMRVEVGGQSVEGTIETPHDPAPIPSPDRVGRGEVFEKVWAPLVLGTVELAKGRSRLVVRALSKPGEQVADLKAVCVRTR